MWNLDVVLQLLQDVTGYSQPLSSQLVESKIALSQALSQLQDDAGLHTRMVIMVLKSEVC